MSAILVQIKDRTKTQAVSNLAEKLKFFSSSQGEEHAARPYITLMMYLGVNPPRKDPVKAAAERLSRNAKKAQAMHPRYSVYVTGCSSNSYDVINGETQKHVYANLLIARDLIHEHTRQGPEYLAAIERMKPTWQAGESFESSGLSWNERQRVWTEAGMPVVQQEDDPAEGCVSSMAPLGEEDEEDED